MKDQSVRCWGRNKDGELGDGTSAARSRPAIVSGIAARDVALGASFSCALTTENTVKCWGSGRIFGDSRIAEKAAPALVPSVTNVSELRAGGYFICAAHPSTLGGVSCWGLDPSPGGEPKSALTLAAAGAHACARLDTGQARCWGEGIWSTTFANPNIQKITDIATGDGFACAVRDDKTVSCWGRNDEGELGMQPDQDDHGTPNAVPGVLNASRVIAAESHVCAIIDGGGIACWGGNDEGELGRGTRTISEKPAIALNLRAKSMAIGADHACAITMEDDLYCWGNNTDGQLGDGTTERHLSPVRVLF